MKTIFIVLVIAIALVAVLFASGCKLEKEYTKATKDSTVVVKVDSGAVKKSDVTNEKQKEYEKTTYLFPRDTINNFFYPTTIIHEKGKEQEQSRQLNYDSIWKAKMDSTAKSQTTVEKKTIMSVLSPMQLIGLGVAGAIFCLLLLNYFLPKKSRS